MKDLYIFDFDGTLSDCNHRLPILSDKTKKSSDRWDEFNLQSVYDKPIVNVLKFFKTLTSSPNVEIQIWTGRSEIVRAQSHLWLCDIAGITTQHVLKMRPVDNYICDHKLKNQWLNELSECDRSRLVCVFEDRQSVVDMWRANNVTCLQVSEGNF